MTANILLLTLTIKYHGDSQLKFLIYERQKILTNQVSAKLFLLYFVINSGINSMIFLNWK